MARGVLAVWIIMRREVGRKAGMGHRTNHSKGIAGRRGSPAWERPAQNLQVVKAENLVETKLDKRCDLWLQGKGMGTGFPLSVLFSVMW